MSSKGLVYLYDSDNNEPIAVRKYGNRQERKKIIQDWRKRYSHAFYRCYIIISPEISEEYDYDAIEKKLDKATKPVKPIKFQRPKAEYKGIYNVEELYKY